MNLIDVAAEIFKRKLNSSDAGLSVETIVKGLQALLPSKGGELDLQALLAQFAGQGGGFGSLAESWLSNDTNKSISAAQILSLFGQENVNAFASRLGLNTVTAAQALGETLPEVIDRSSLGGKLLDNMQVKGAKSLLGGLFD